MNWPGSDERCLGACEEVNGVVTGNEEQWL
jgi:hypothetical protein